MGNVVTPFLGSRSFEAQEVAPSFEGFTSLTRTSPFLSVYEREDGENVATEPLREAYATLMNELRDDEFEEALSEVIEDARALHADKLAAGRSRGEADRLIVQHFSRFTREAEALIDAAQGELGARPEQELEDSELETFVQRYLPSRSIEPAFENLLGKIFKKVKSAAGKALRVAKSLGLGVLLGRIRPLIGRFAKLVIGKVIGSLPESVRPAGRLLAQKLGFALPASRVAASATAALSAPAGSGSAAAPTGVADAGGAPASDGAAAAGPSGDATSAVAASAELSAAAMPAAVGATTSELEDELDRSLAEAVLADEGPELELELAREATTLERSSPTLAELEDARERFIQGISELRQGESAEPLVQNFLPAILPALKLVISLAGRNRFIGLASPLMAKFIARLVGPEQAPALARALIDSGMRLMSLEASEDEQGKLAASAVAATVEEATCRLAAHAHETLEDRELFEGHALQAFEQAAAANLPAVLSEATYQKRPELLEAGVNAGWVFMPLHGRKRYKRCTRSFTVKVTPDAAHEIESFEGSSLAEHLHEQLGLGEGAEMEAEMHLYEALPGTSVVDIASGERETIGLGADEASGVRLHPFTRQAAGVLLGRPGLGRDLAQGATRQNLALGQRLFHLTLPGHGPLVAATAGTRHKHRLAHVNIVLDATKQQLRVSLFLSEARAQKLAVRMREQHHAGQLSVAFQRFLARRLPGLLAGRHGRRFRLVHADLSPGQKPAFERLSAQVSRVLASKLNAWLTHGYRELVKSHHQEFLAAANQPQDGVTVRFFVDQPAGLSQLAALLTGKAPADAKLVELLAQAPLPSVRVEVLPGHQCV